MSYNNYGIPKKIYEVDVNNVDLINTLTEAIYNNTINNLVGENWFELSDEELVDAERLLIWLNVCDRLNRLQSVFSYVPITNENGQSFTANGVTISLLYVPVRDHRGAVVMEEDPIFGKRPKMVPYHNVPLPPIDLSQGPDAIQWFENQEVNDKANLANKSFVSPQQANELRRNRQRVPSLNPTNDFITKLAFRQQGVHTIGYPVVETVYLPMWTSSNPEKAQRVDIPIAVQWNDYEKRIEFTKDSYSFIKNQRANFNKSSWNTTTADAIRLDTNLQAIASKIKDPVKLREFYRTINEVTEEVISNGNVIDKDEFIKPKKTSTPKKTAPKKTWSRRKKVKTEDTSTKPEVVVPEVA